MKLNLVSSTAVVVAKQFNPSIIREHWLITRGILTEDDFLPGCVYTDVLAQVKTRYFNMLVTPDQCQFSPRVELEDEQDILTEKLGSFVTHLPETPYSAIGLNFTWRLHPENESVEQFTRRMFFISHSALHERLGSKDARFGVFISTDLHGFRLKLDIKPGSKEEGQIQLSFNFHLDLKADQDVRLHELQEALNKWNEVKRESIALTNLVGEENVS